MLVGLKWKAGALTQYNSLKMCVGGVGGVNFRIWKKRETKVLRSWSEMALKDWFDRLITPVHFGILQTSILDMWLTCLSV